MTPIASATQLHQVALVGARSPFGQGEASPGRRLLQAAEDTASLDLAETAGALTGEGDSDALTALGVVEGLRDVALGLDSVEDGALEHSRSLVAEGLTRATLALASMAPGLAGEAFAAASGVADVVSGALRHDRAAELSGLLQAGAAAGLLAMMAGLDAPIVGAGILACEVGRLACRLWPHAVRPGA